MPAGDGAPLPDDPATDRRQNGARPGAPEGASWETRLLVAHAEMAFGLCGRVAKQAEDANWVGMGGDTMFARFSHAMHVSIALKAKLEAAAERRARGGSVGLVCDRLVDDEQDAARVRGEAGVQDRVEAAVEADPADAARLRLNLAVRLGHLDVTREIEGRSFGEVIAEVRRDLGLPAEGFEVPADVPVDVAPALTRLAALGTLSREAGEGKEGGLAPFPATRERGRRGRRFRRWMGRMAPLRVRRRMMGGRMTPCSTRSSGGRRVRCG